MDEIIDYTKLSNEELLNLEKLYKNNFIKYNTLQMAEKILLNSLYGALGAGGAFRYFNVNLAASITATGRLAILWIQRKLNELIDKETGIKKDRIVLIDTDSVVMNLEDLVNKHCDQSMSEEEKLKFLIDYSNDVLDPYIQSGYEELSQYCNHFKQKLHMKRENIVKTMINVAAKAYIMEVYDSEGVRYSIDSPKMKIMGIQAIKSSVCKIIRDAILTRAVPILLHGTEQDLQNFVLDFKKEYFNASVEQIAFPRTVNSIDVYLRSVWSEKLQSGDSTEREIARGKLNFKNNLYVKGTPINSKAGIIYNHLLSKHGLDSSRNKVLNGDKIKYVYLKTPNPIGEDVVGFQDSLPEEFGVNDFIDYDTMFEKSFISILQGMAEPLGWSLKKTNNLESFFS